MDKMTILNCAQRNYVKKQRIRLHENKQTQRYNCSSNV